MRCKSPKTLHTFHIDVWRVSQSGSEQKLRLASADLVCFGLSNREILSYRSFSIILTLHQKAVQQCTPSTQIKSCMTLHAVWY